MSEQLTLPAEARDRAGKGASRALRRDGRVPAVVYGEKKEPLSIHVEEKLLTKMLSTGHFMNSVVMIDVGGKPHRTLPKAVDFHPVTQPADPRRFPAHRRAHQGARRVPVRFDNEEASPGLKRGGVLNVVQHELELVCDAAQHPERDPHRARPASRSAIRSTSARSSCPTASSAAIDDRDFTVATIVAPSAMKAEEEEAAAAEARSRPSRARKAEGEGEGDERLPRAAKKLSLPACRSNQEPLARTGRAVSFWPRSR